MNKNAFRFTNTKIPIDLSLNPGQEKEVKIELSENGPEGELDSFPYHIDCALKVFEDAYVFRVPCSMTVAMIPNASKISLDEYKDLVSNPQYTKKQEVLDHRLSVTEFVQKLLDNNLIEIFRQDSGNHEKMAFAC